MNAYDKTRLINLLNNNRDDMITTYATQCPHIPITDIVDRVDRSIQIIKSNIRTE